MKPESKNGSAAIALVVVILAVLILAGIWHYETREPTSVSNSGAPTTSSASPTSISCPSNASSSLIPYENGQMGIAFCYPADLAVTVDSLDKEFVDLVWPKSYTDISYGRVVTNPVLKFGIVEASSGTIIDQVSGCDFEGQNGESVCLPPKASQIVTAVNSNGLSYVFYRTAFVGNGTDVISSSTGPYAYFPLTSNEYLIFQPSSGATLPSYVDSDLKEILNTVMTVSD